ncbi:MAG: DUF4861 family protein [Bacteroidota bacterium]
MKRMLFCFFSLCLYVAVQAQQRTITVSNSLTQGREELIEIPWTQVMNAFSSLDTANFKVINATTKKEYPYQLEYKGTSQVQHLLVQLSIPAKGAVRLQLVKGKAKPVVAKTFCRYVPERKDDFAWENDRIAHRMYGRALEKTPGEMAYGVDVWVKRTDRLVINERYRIGEYHVDHGDGMDYYHVGLTLGAGSIAPYIHDTIWFPRNYSEWKVLDNGPLRSTFQVGYDEWTAAGRKVKVKKTISIDAGSQLSKNEVIFETEANDPLPVVTGIIKRKEAGEMLLNEKEGILAYWEPKHGEDGITGVACIMKTPVSQMLVTGEHLLAKTAAQSKIPLIYYSGAAWNKAGLILSASDWFRYLQGFQKSITDPINITIK